MLRLLRTHLATHAGSLLTVAVLVLTMSTLTALMPRATSHVLTDALRHRVGDLTTVQRDLTAREPGSPTPGAAEDPAGNALPEASDSVWGALDDAMRDARARMPARLRSVFGPGEFAVSLPTAAARPRDPGVQVVVDVILGLGFDPRLPDHVRITKGRAPAQVTARAGGSDPIEIVLAEAVATRMDWPIGQRRVTDASGGPIDVLLSGTYVAKDERDPIWAQVSGTLKPSVFLPDPGRPVITGVGWVDPGSYSQLLPLTDHSVVSAWFPLDTSALTSRDTAGLATQLRQFSRQAHPVPGEEFLDDRAGQPSIFGLTRLGFSTGSTNAVRDADIAGSSALAIIALFASGPLGVAAVVLVLAAGLVLRQQRRSLALVAARGASEAQLRTLLAIEGLVVGLPAAAAGAAIGALLLPHEGNAAAWWWPLLVGLTPAVLMAAMQPPTTRPERADLSSHDRRRWRWVLDLLVLVGAAAAIVALRTRGLAKPVTGAGIDPLLAGAPVLLSLAACLGVVRLYPRVLQLLLTRVSRWRGSTALLGTARALRDPAAGLAAVLALVTSVAIAVFSGVATTTLQQGLADTSRTAVGADVVVRGESVDPQLVSTLSARKDVRHLAAVTEQTGVPLSAGGKPIFERVLFVDVAALRKVQEGVPGALRLPRSLGRTTGDRLPVLVSEGFDKERSTLEIGGVRAEVVGTGPVPNPLSDLSSWILVDRAAAEHFGQTAGPPGRVLVDTAGSAAGVRDLVRASPGKVETQTPADLAAQLEVSPLVPGVRHAAQLALAVLAVLCLSVIALALVRGEGSRSRQSALVGAMGQPRRRTRWLVAWEVGPLSAVSVVSGLAVGLLLPAVVLGSIDLRVFTTGRTQPPITIDPVLTTLVVVGVLTVVVAGAVVAAVASRRQDLSRLLRMMED